MNNPETDWHRLEPETVFDRLQASQQGLTAPQAMQRLKKFGYNELRTARPGALSVS